MKIIGAGMAGLLAAGMLRKYQPEVLEAQTELPNNHGALLRFRSNEVAEASGQRFKRVEVTKGVLWNGSVLSGSAPIPAVNMYSRKVTGEVRPRSVMNLEPSVRWIAPDDFTESLARGLDVKLGVRVMADMIAKWSEEGHPIISTIPMPVLMRMVDWDTVLNFRWQPIWSMRSVIRSPLVDVYQTIYYPHPREPYYRASITGNLLIIESLEPITAAESMDLGWIDEVLHSFGIPRIDYTSPEVHYQEYGKIIPCSNPERKAFILAMTDRYRIYSLGRFGTWRQLLLDDLVNDIRTIDAMITDRDAYNRHLNWRIN